jgi:hypothetical protein
MTIDRYADTLYAPDLYERLTEIWELIEAEDATAEDLDDKEILEAIEGLEDLAHEGEILIRDTYFKDYAQELADDIGALDKADQWPLTCIDWEQAARELQYDYTVVTVAGIDYWHRAY